MQTIYLDISNKGVIPCVVAKQSEVGRKFLAVITDNGSPYNIPSNSLLSVWYEGDTDAGNYSSIEGKSAFSIDGNKVTVELVAQMLLKPGKGELCLSITHGDGGETNTWNIPYLVEYKPGASSSVPTEYYTALTEAGALAAESVSNSKEQATLSKQYAENAQKSYEDTKEYVENNAAPAGYGYGDALPIWTGGEDYTLKAFLYGLTETMAANTTRQFRFTGGNADFDGIDAPNETFYGTVYRSGRTDYFHIEATGDKGSKVRISYEYGSWTPWEWQNPPMIKNIEYRTTERYNGYPVYVKRLDIGNLPNNAYKVVDAVPVEPGIVYYPMSVYGTAYNAKNLEYYTIPTENAKGTVGQNVALRFQRDANGKGVVVVSTNINVSAHTAEIVLKYHKFGKQ